jgi:hypothetical protein
MPERDRDYVIGGALFIGGLIIIAAYFASIWDKVKEAGPRPKRDDQD